MNPVLRAWSLLAAITLVFSTVIAVPQPVAVQAAGPAELFFSEYIEGSSNNKALEIFNGTGASIDLSAGGYKVQMFFNGSATASLTINLTGTVANGDVYVLAHGSAVADILNQADQTNSSGWFNGNDAVALLKDTTIIDVIGQIGVDPVTEWGSGDTSTANNTLRRKAAILAGDPDGSNVFDPSLEWDGYAQDTYDGLGSHTVSVPEEDTAPTVSSTTPSDGTIGVALDANLTVSFSEAVDTAEGWFDISCFTSGDHTAVVSGGPQEYTLDPAVDFTNETCTMTIYADKITDQDTDDPPDNLTINYVVEFLAGDACQADFTEIPAIQGSGTSAAITGDVTTRGVVVGDYEGGSGTLHGFFLQSQAGDGDPATSDGIFVYNGNTDSVALGDVVWVWGSASDYSNETQISAASIVACGTGSAAPVDVTFPVASDTFLERYEGMLVHLPQTMYVTEHYQLGRYGQVVVSSSDRLWQPTNIFPPGSEADALQAANNLNRIIIDDALNSQNPDPILFGRGGLPLSAGNTLRGGDTITGAVGVMNYYASAYRLRPVYAMEGYWTFTAANQRPTTPDAVDSELKVATLNVLNYFNTFTGCTLGVGGDPTDCRGAEDSVEFERQSAKIVSAILKMDSAVVGLVEIENDGYGVESALADLVNRLNTASTPGTYAFIDVDFNTSQINALGTDAIKVGLIYQPSLVTPTGDTAALNTVAFVNAGDAEARNRPALAQTFIDDATGELFTVVVNHFKSKGSACDDPDAGDLQGNCNLVRVTAATELANWLAADPTGTGVTNILIMGDLNAYAKEDPIAALETAGYSNMLAAYQGAGAYTYVFDGQWGNLDHALASHSMLIKVTGVTSYHINADEPAVLDYNTNYKTVDQISSLYAPDEFRASDHDAVIVGLKLDIFEVFLPLISR